MFGRKQESPEHNDIDTLVIEEEPILDPSHFDNTGPFGVDFNEEQIIAGEYHDVQPPSKSGNRRKVIFLAVVAIFAVGGVVSIFSPTSVDTLRSDVSRAIPLLGNSTPEKPADSFALAEQLQTPEVAAPQPSTPAQILPESLQSSQSESSPPSVATSSPSTENAHDAPTVDASAPSLTPLEPASEPRAPSSASLDSQQQPSASAKHPEVAVTVPATPEKQAAPVTPESPQVAPASSPVQQPKAAPGNTSTSATTAAEPATQPVAEPKKASEAPKATVEPRVKAEPIKEAPKQTVIAKTAPKATREAKPASKNEAAEKPTSDADSEASIKRLVTLSAESLGLVAMQPGFITIERKGGGTNRLGVGDRLDSGEQITHIDAASSTVVTDRSVIRITL